MPVRKSRGGEAAEGVHDGWDPLFIGYSAAYIYIYIYIYF